MTFQTQRLYQSYTSTHAGLADPGATAHVYRRDIRRHLPAPASRHRVLDLGCGQGELVRLLHADGFEVRGVDISPEQVTLARSSGLHQVELGNFFDYLAAGHGRWDAIIATDVLEHLEKPDVIATFDGVWRALRPGGIFVARVPNAVSPTGGHVMYGDFTHQTTFTRRSVAQLGALAGFANVRSYACPPLPTGLRSAARAMAWKPISGFFKLALAAETGQLRGHIVTQNLTFVARREGHRALGMHPAISSSHGT